MLKGSGSLEDLHQSLALNLTPAVSAVVRSVVLDKGIWKSVMAWRHPQALTALISPIWDHPAHGPGPYFSSLYCQAFSSDVAAVLVSSFPWLC